MSTGGAAGDRPVGVIVPAHQEAVLLPRCLDALRETVRVAGVTARIVVVCDDCTDDTAAAARRGGAEVVSVSGRCVGAARAAGAAYLLEAGAHWLATTDADTRVAPAWLAEQLALAESGADAVCGVVDVDDWSGHPVGTAAAFTASYDRRDGHGHVHGASFGVSAIAYVAAGGWPALPAHEDVALVEALRRSGFTVVASSQVAATTSARIDPRAPEGFGHRLRSLGVSA